MDTFDFIVSEYQDRMKMLSDAMARGQCVSMEEYKFASGQFRGLEVACAIVQDLKQKMESADE